MATGAVNLVDRGKVLAQVADGGRLAAHAQGKNTRLADVFEDVSGPS